MSGKFEDLERVERSAREASDTLEKQGKLSDESASILGGEDFRVNVPDIRSKRGTKPVFATFLFDESGSMDGHRKHVIDAHAVMLDALRGSRACKKNALYVSQYVFSDSERILNTFELLDPNKKDAIVTLDRSNYNPGGQTALYKSIFRALQSIATTVEYALRKSIIIEHTIAVITDGMDNIGGVSPKDINTVVNDFKKQYFLRSSVVVGLTSDKLSESDLEEIRRTLGFDQAISTSRSEKEIRRAFVLASEPNL